jgi:hypothetical protein
LKFAQAFGDSAIGNLLIAVPGDVFAIGFVLGLGGWVSYKLYRLRGSELVLYPLLLWLNALGSCVGAIANDYSLIFLPIAVVAVTSFKKDPWFVRISMLLLVLWWQPIDIGIPAIPFLIIKALGLIAVGVSIVRRAREMCLIAEADPALPTAQEAAPAVAQAKPALLNS